ncbi:MAG: DUF2231 domain-containing protein [Thermogutta sp.]
MFPVAAGWLPPAPPTPPPPEGYHVLLIHFPIALLLVAPLFILLGALVAARWQGFAVVAALLMVLGTAGTWVAVSTGETARDVIEEASDEALEVLEEHEELGELTRNIYTGLTAAYVIFVLLTLVWGPIAKAAIRIPLGLIFLALSAGAALYLAGTAHLGGRLVHEYGIRATLAEAARPASGEAREKDTERSGAEAAEEAREGAAEQTAEEAAEKTGEEAGEKAGGEVGKGRRDAAETPAEETSSGKEPAGAAEEQPSGEATPEPTAPANEETPAEQTGEATMEPPAETPGTEPNGETPNTGSNAGSNTEPPSTEPAEGKPAPTDSPEPPAAASS